MHESTVKLVERLEQLHNSFAVLRGSGTEKYEVHLLLIEAAEEIKKLLAAADQPRD